MSLVVSNTGEIEMLKRIVGQTTTNIVIHLYSNNYEPIETSVVGDFTESTGNGYTEKTLIAGSWSISGDPTEASYAEQEFVYNADASTYSVYGFYMTNVAGTVLLWAEKFTDGPYIIQTAGGSIFVTPKIQLA